jgi:acetyltransferase-like isoleucine patch superfamily enzyme
MTTPKSLLMTMMRMHGVNITTEPDTLFIHPEVYFEPPCDIGALLTLHAPLQVGSFSHLNGGDIRNASIGRYCSFARDVQIGLGIHPTDWLSISPLQYMPGYRGWSRFASSISDSSHDEVATLPYVWDALTTIGNDVWLGNHVIVKDGVTIGDGVIVGAGSVVTKNLPSYSIAVGTPARVIRMRFPENIIERLNYLQWWQYNMAEFGEIQFSKIDRALDHIECMVTQKQLVPYAPEWCRASALAEEKF